MQNACCAGLGWWQTPMSWPPVEILFQQQLPTGTSVHVPTPALYSIPSVGLFWPPTKSPHAAAHSWESARAAGEQHGGWWHSHTTAGLRAGKPALPPSRAGSSSLREGSAAISFILPRDIRDICSCCGSQAVVSSRQAWKQAHFFAAHRQGLPGCACVAVHASEHPLVLKSHQCKPALCWWGFVKCIAGFAFITTD